ncbi:MAG TPA: hypothetical protein VMH24_01630, partial [Candidatus Sulfotelmatobacter sp.]|nr:hypothetical protein [Candidatus Sulfotelmatobacter sp.]
LELALAEALTADAEAGLAALPSVAATGRPVTASGRAGVYVLPTDDASVTLREVTAWLEGRRLVPVSLRFGAPSLEDVYLRLTGDGATGDDGGLPGATGREAGR